MTAVHKMHIASHMKRPIQTCVLAGKLTVRRKQANERTLARAFFSTSMRTRTGCRLFLTFGRISLLTRSRGLNARQIHQNISQTKPTHNIITNQKRNARVKREKNGRKMLANAVTVKNTIDSNERSIRVGIFANCMVMHPRSVQTANEAFLNASNAHTAPQQQQREEEEGDEDGKNYMLHIKLSHLNDSYKITQDPPLFVPLVPSRPPRSSFGRTDCDHSFVSSTANKLIYLIVYCLAWRVVSARLGNGVARQARVYNMQARNLVISSTRVQCTRFAARGNHHCTLVALLLRCSLFLCQQK